MLKADFHIHCSPDPEDFYLKYNAFKLIDKAKELDFDVIAITPHEGIFDYNDAFEYAESKGILLIPGIEKSISGKHTLILNPPKEIMGCHTIKELKKLKLRHPDILIIAPHPFYADKSCHKNNIVIHKDLFDAWEFCHFYSSKINPNKKLEQLSRIHKKPIVGNSDAHDLKHLGRTFTLIDAPQDTQSIFQAIRDNKIKVKSKPLSNTELIIKAVKRIAFKPIKPILKIFN